MDDDVIPSIEFSDEELANIRASLGVTEIPESDSSFEQPEAPPRRRRGRPRKSPLPDEPTFTPPEFTKSIDPAPLTKRDEREVASRLQQILTGSTGILGLAKPYLEMTDEEAKDIAEPLSSYLVRNADTIPVARQVLENYDLAAIVLGVMAYVVRVYHDRREEVDAIRAAGPISQTTTLDRISQYQEGNNGRQPNEGSGPKISVPNDEGSAGIYGPNI